MESLLQKLNTSPKAINYDLQSQLQRLPVMLLALHYGFFNSKFPSTFLRGLPGYKAGTGHDSSLLTPPPSPGLASCGCDHFVVTLTSGYKTGPSGHIHDAEIEVDLGAGTVVCEARVKLAFTESEKMFLEREASILDHLMARKTQGIEHHLGVFHDAAPSGPLCLLLTKREERAGGESPTLAQCSRYRIDIHRHSLCSI
jgi:hypothetical protein